MINCKKILSRQRLFVCHMCDYNVAKDPFLSKNGLRDHMTQNHFCRKCKKYFVKKDEFESHDNFHQ